MTFRFIAIDDSIREEHTYLTKDDVCYFLGEYQARAGFAASVMNNTIANLKKPVSKRGLPEYRYKDAAINQANSMIRNALSAQGIATSTFIPIPPSKCRTDALFDDRMMRILSGGTPPLDVRDIFQMRISLRPHHEYQEGERRPTVADLEAAIDVDDAQLQQPLGNPVFLVDDVITNGTHFKACKRLILDRVPQSQIVGLFLARRRVS